jgi:hypothetical protein
MAQRRIRVKKRVCAIHRILALDGSAFFKWYAFNSMFLFFFLSFFVFYIFVLILNMIKLNVYVCSGTCGMSVAIALAVTPTTFNLKGYSELFPSELAQTFNN